jgi:glycosyltransferase involved in cell wall biosynthesis
MNFLFFCSSVDVNNPIIADTIKRAASFKNNSKVKDLFIISIHGESGEVNGIKVYGLGSKPSWLKLISLYFLLIKLFFTRKIDIIYLYMTPTMAPIFFPFKVFGAKIASWFGHTVYTPWTRICLNYFTDFWFNANESMAPYKNKNLIFVGQGVDENTFFPKETPKKYDLITVGRITPIKKLELIFYSLKKCNETNGTNYNVAICGDAFVKEDIEYKEFLKQEITRLNLDENVKLIGNVKNDNLADTLRESKAFIFTVPGGVGKASLEAFACGLPLIISSPEARDFFGDFLSDYFLCNSNEVEISNKIHEILSLNGDKKQEVLDTMNAMFLQKYTLNSFTSRIVDHLNSAT